MSDEDSDGSAVVADVERIIFSGNTHRYNNSNKTTSRGTASTATTTVDEIEHDSDESNNVFVSVAWM